uniref:Uncharacterized protein n=1 Tax=Arundo donax TaxID=35708 RepID=A0A0A9A7S5_ARUDO
MLQPLFLHRPSSAGAPITLSRWRPRPGRRWLAAIAGCGTVVKKQMLKKGAAQVSLRLAAGGGGHGR